MRSNRIPIESYTNILRQERKEGCKSGNIWDSHHGEIAGASYNLLSTKPANEVAYSRWKIYFSPRTSRDFPFAEKLR